MGSMRRRLQNILSIAFKMIAPMAVALGFAAANPASAVTISIYNNETSTQRSIIDCFNECSAALFNAAGTLVTSFSATIGDAVAGPGNSSPSSQTSFVNSALGTSFATGVQTSPATDGTTYVINAAYVLLHFGAGNSGLGYLLLKNTSLDGAFSFVYNKFPGSNGGGLSNFTAIGTYVAPIPVPAGIALGAAGLGMLGLLGWRRKKALAA